MFTDYPISDVDHLNRSFKAHRFARRTIQSMTINASQIKTSGDNAATRQANPKIAADLPKKA